MIIQSLVLIEGNVEKNALLISLKNAKQLVIGNAPAFGFILHVAANSHADLNKALLDFAKIVGVTAVTTLSIQNS